MERQNQYLCALVLWCAGTMGLTAIADHALLPAVVDTRPVQVGLVSTKIKYQKSIEWLKRVFKQDEALALATVTKLDKFGPHETESLIDGIAEKLMLTSPEVIQRLDAEINLKLAELNGSAAGESEKLYRYLSRALAKVMRANGIASTPPATAMNRAAPAALPIPQKRLHSFQVISQSANLPVSPVAGPKGPETKAIRPITAAKPTAIWKSNRKQRQIGSNWCWAACVQNLLGQLGVEASQREIVTRTYGGPYDRPAPVALIPKVFNLYGNAIGAKASAASFDMHRDPRKIRQALGRGNKVMVLVGTPMKGHVCVAEGMDARGNILLYDPMPGKVFRVPYAQLSRTWFGSIVVKPPGNESEIATRNVAMSSVGDAYWPGVSKDASCFSDRSIKIPQ